jgi:hypothetical protein
VFLVDSNALFTPFCNLGQICQDQRTVIYNCGSVVSFEGLDLKETLLMRSFTSCLSSSLLEHQSLNLRLPSMPFINGISFTRLLINHAPRSRPGEVALVTVSSKPFMVPSSCCGHHHLSFASLFDASINTLPWVAPRTHCRTNEAVLGQSGECSERDKVCTCDWLHNLRSWGVRSGSRVLDPWGNCTLGWVDLLLTFRTCLPPSSASSNSISPPQRGYPQPVP